MYFILKFALAHYEYLTLNLLYNGLLLLFILLPFRNRVLSLLQTGVAIVAAFALVYSESWLPGPDSIISNAQNIAGFSAAYIAQLAVDFVNIKMLAWGAAVVLLYCLVKDWVRISVFTLVYFLCLVFQPYYVAWRTQDMVFVNERLESIMEKVERWYNMDVFFQNERLKEARFYGNMKRYTPIEDLLFFLERTSDARFSINGRTIVVGEK